MRIDRAVSVFIAHPLAKVLSSSPQQGMPILMYHGIREPKAGSRPYYETCTRPELFERHMDFLAENGYTALTLAAGLRLFSESRLPKRSVVLTFDDGFQDFYLNAFEILQQRNFGATVFVITGLTGDYERCSFKGIPCLTWKEIEEVHAAGIEIGSHTVTHRELAYLGEDDIRQELQYSKESIEQALGSAVCSFSYPFAFPETVASLKRRLTMMLQDMGYKSGVSTIIGTARPAAERFFLPRLPVNAWDDLKLFEAKLEGGYDWLHLPQRLFKQAKSLARIAAENKKSKRGSDQIASDRVLSVHRPAQPQQQAANSEQVKDAIRF
jgi:peptidoglycan/xylan/chitin deacetylase (PgdA/CDA1 family)